MTTSASQALADKQQLILLHPNDNVLICVAQIHAGDLLDMDGEKIPAQKAIAVGHKLARVNLQPGDKVLRYGAPIGSMVAAAAKGEHVHMHNMKSDYIPSHTRQAQSEKTNK